MGTILASAIRDQAEEILKDSGNAQFTEANLLVWLNEGQRFIVRHKHDENMVTGNVQLVEGVRQTLPAGSHRLYDVANNMGTDGATVGNAITLVKKRDMDLERPAWQTDTADAAVYHYSYDQDDPLTFWVWPPQPSSGQGYVRIVRSAIPADIAAGTAITVSDSLESVLIDYMLYKAYTVDSTSPISKAKANTCLTRVLQALGMSEQIDNAKDPSSHALREVTEP